MGKICVDCGARVSKTATRCKSCSNKLNGIERRRRNGIPDPPWFCPDCGVEVSRPEIRCHPCGAKKWRARQREETGIGKPYLCKNCGAEISWGRNRCRFCALEKRKEDNARHRRALGIPDPPWVCPDCGSEVSAYGNRCRSCSSKHFWIDPEMREKMLANRPTSQSRESNEKRSKSLKKALASKTHRKIMSKAARDSWTEERREEWGKKQRKFWRDPSIRRKRLRALRKALRCPAYREKKRKEMLARYEDPMEREKQAERTRQMWADGIFDGVFQSPTSIELETAAALDILGIDYKFQHRPENYSKIFDFWVMPDILIEVNGNYWHSDENNPGIEARDAEKESWAKDNGYEFIALWESEIKKYGAWSLVIECVLPLIKE